MQVDLGSPHCHMHTDKQSDYSAHLDTGWILTYVLPASIPPISPSYLSTSAGIIIIDRQAKPFHCVDQASTDLLGPSSPNRQALTHVSKRWFLSLALVRFHVNLHPQVDMNIIHARTTKSPPAVSGNRNNIPCYICVAFNCSPAKAVYLYDLTLSPPETHPPLDFSSL